MVWRVFKVWWVWKDIYSVLAQALSHIDTINVACCLCA